ncbi:Hypothetical protein SMAX5B_019595 [Scophthalmus maximus]|uniref:Uncharacterized protein n=1 Tax=Scophthalmus maximus TaxID=52904 RepID=A0A2U9D016_SCOMX|nr:Hypothetical protein SMAX5B_019595 [Scophthalmus maximus]
MSNVTPEILIMKDTVYGCLESRGPLDEAFTLDLTSYRLQPLLIQIALYCLAAR